MARLVAFLRASLTAGVAFLYLFVVGTPFVLHAWWTRSIDPLYRAAWWGVWLALRVAGVRVQVVGGEYFPRQGPCLYMSNHVSNVDPLVLFTVLPPRIAVMAKKQVFGIPVLGWALSLADFVAVEREDPEAARASVEEALAKLQRGVSFLVYPEGSRSRDGCLQRFKHGVFVLAIRAGVPIVPLAVVGADAVMRKGRWEIYPGVVQVTVHPPVETRTRSLEERHQLAQEVRGIIASALPEAWRGAEPSPVPEAETMDDRL
ncbi:MAG: lysophospholipid acyltransferase family protein [Terriglobia bacterium]